MRAHHMNLEAHALAQNQCQKNVVVPGSYMALPFRYEIGFMGEGARNNGYPRKRLFSLWFPSARVTAF